jgi:hypothetical protein
MLRLLEDLGLKCLFAEQPVCHSTCVHYIAPGKRQLNALIEIQRATARRVVERHALRFARPCARAPTSWKDFRWAMSSKALPKILDTALVVSLFWPRRHGLRVT